MWSYLAGKVIRNRVIFLIVVALFTAFMAYKVQFLQMSYEYASLLPKTDSVYLEMTNFKKTFGEDANVIIAGFQDENFFEKEKFNDWQKLMRQLRKHDYVLNVFSAADAYGTHKDLENSKFDFVKIFPDSVNSQQELDSLKLQLHKYPFFDNLVYIKDSSFYFVAITVSPKVINDKAREAFMDDIEGVMRAYAKDNEIDIKISGLPYMRTRISMMVKKELYMFIGLAMLVTAFILYLFFRSFKVVFFSMLIVGIGVVWSLSTLVLLGYQVTILTAMIPPLIIVIGIPNGVFLLNKYHHEYRKHGNKIKALHRVISKVGNATFLTNLSTAAGFATFISTGNNLLTEFGIVASVNIMGVFVLSITLIPVFFSFLPAPKDRHVKHIDNKLVAKMVDYTVYLVSNKRKAIYITVIVLSVVAVFGISKMRTQGFIVDDIPQDNPVFMDLKYFENMTGGVMPFEITVIKRSGDTLNYADIKRINTLQDSLLKYKFLTRSLSIANAIMFANQAYNNGNPKTYRFPTLTESSNLQPYIKNLSGSSNSGNSNNLLKSFVDSSFATARVSARMKDIGMHEMRKLRAGLRPTLDTIFPKATYETHITGSSVVFTQGTAHLVNNLFGSLALAILMISIIMAAMFTSYRMILISLIPNILPLTFTAAIMGFMDIPLKPSTILIFSIAFGIAVDNAIHFFTKYRQELKLTNWDIKKSTILALKETSVSVIYTISILFVGFGIFVMSDFGGTVALGLLISLTLLFAATSNSLLLPSLLLTLDKRLTTKAFNNDLLKQITNVETEPVEIKD